MLLSAKSRKTVGKVSDIAEIAKNNAESLGMDNEHNAKQSVEQNFHAMRSQFSKYPSGKQLRNNAFTK